MILFIFFKDTATTEIYTLSLHDALPIWRGRDAGAAVPWPGGRVPPSGVVALDGEDAVAEAAYETADLPAEEDRKSTRLNSSHANISYAVFCLKKKKNYYYVM